MKPVSGGKKQIVTNRGLVFHPRERALKARGIREKNYE
ncbi:hypothetical protein X474_20735 [Dethiosulfatarculus sandiegensis]|uniref:Uncharacterized protein n=1 Tax=Dethiosulfatarculus sandiegensis TaxID=1429043 RepID=A0A0D2J267_9BACT|nr:hypothetical protein X474_20735 [Dethiosulfatarculus sandiegensis]